MFIFRFKIHGLTSKRDSYCTIYCLHKFYLTKVVGIDFKSAVLNFLKKMTLPRITIDNNVKYVPKGRQAREIKQNTIKNKLTFKKQSKKI